MNNPVDVSRYRAVLFIDSMMVLEGKPLTALPWHEIDRTGPILILIVPQVMKEIDKFKRDGRLAKRAREFNRLVGPAAESGLAMEISPGPPRVDVAFATVNRVDWDALDDLDPEEGDARVVAQVLNAKLDGGISKTFLSFDNNPIAMASRHGIQPRKPPSHWLLDPEPSPHEKELQRLKSKVAELQSSEPEVEVDIRFEASEPLEVYRVEALTPAEQYALVARILRENKKEDQDSDIFGIGSRDYSYDERYERYCDVILPRHAARIHRYIEETYGQIGLSITLRVGGHIQAENLVLTIQSEAGGLHNKFISYPIYGPIAPRPRIGSDILGPLRNLNDRRSVGRHDVEFAIGPDGGRRIEAHCADFRHGRKWEFDGIARIDPHAEGPFRISVGVTASNLHGSVTKTFEQSFAVKSVKVAELINLERRGGFLIDFPMRAQFKAALEAKNHNWFDTSFGRDSEDDDD